MFFLYFLKRKEKLKNSSFKIFCVQELFYVGGGFMKFKVFLLALAAVALLMFPVWASANNPNTVIEENERAVATLDPAWAYDTGSGQVLNNIYDNLIQYNGVSVTKFLPMLSTNVPSVKDGTILNGGKTYIFHIRKGVYFHNGDLLTPEDVVYTFERIVIFDRAGGPQWMLAEPLLPEINGSYVDSITQWAVKLAGVKSWDDLFVNGTRTPKNAKYKKALIDAFNLLAKDFVIKGDEVIINLPHPYPPFLSIICHGAFWSSIIDKKWAKSVGAWPGTADTWWLYHNPIREKDPLYSVANGTGPFELERWTAGREVVLKRFDKYWAGPAKIQYAIIKVIKEFTTRKLDLLRGNADVISVPPSFLEQVANVKDVNVSKSIPVLGIYNFFFNFNVQPHSKFLYSGKLDGNGVPPDFFSNLDVRKAFEYMFPYKTYIKDVWYGQGIHPNGPIPKGLLGYSANTPSYNFDLSKAIEYFKKAYNGKLWKIGFKVAVTYNVSDKTMQMAAQMLSAYARKINPKFKVVPVGLLWASLLDNQVSGSMPIYALDWFADYAGPYDFVYPYLDSNGPYGASLGKNFISLAKKEFDPLVTESMKVTDPAKRQKIYEELNLLSYKYATMMWLIQPSRQIISRRWLKGLYPDNYNPMFNKELLFYKLYKK